MAVLGDDLRRKAEELAAKYPDPRSALLPILYLLQAEEGYVSRDGMQEAAEIVGLTTAQVEAVATFYTMFKKQPAGRWLISVCTNLSCGLAGALRVYERAKEELGPDAGTMTGDGLFTLEEAECLGACDAAPVVQINYCNYDRVDQDGIVRMIDQLRAGEVPEPSRGPKPVDHRATARILAGLGDDRG